MKMKYNREKKVLEINDNLKMHYMLIRFVFIISILNAVLRMYNNYLADIKNEAFIIVLGIVSVIALIFMRTRSVQDIIPLDEIEYLRERKFFGSRRFSFKLIDGKIRNLPVKKKDLNKFDDMIKETGIEIIQNSI
jgi:hypothetical protein